MKKQILLSMFLFTANYIASFGQQSLYFPVGIVDNRVDIGDLDVGGYSITVEALITKQTSTGTINDIVCKHLNSNDCNYFLRSSSFTIRTTSGVIGVTNPIVPCSDSCYHVAGTYDGDSLKYYVNGIKVASVHWTGTLYLNNNIAAIGNMWNQNGSYDEQYYGYIDEVRIWNVARSQTEIESNMYNLPNPTAQPGLLAYYQFNGNYKNIQGNISWDGTPIGAQTSLAVNPHFHGNVSFCNFQAVVPPVSSFLASDSVICANDCIEFTNNSSNATSWYWSFPGGSPSTSTIQNPQICYLTSGIYDVTLVASNSGSRDTLTINNCITVKTAPATPSITQHNDTLFCSSNVSYTSYQWYLDSTIINGATDTLLIISHGGNYNIKVSNNNGCSIGVGINVVGVDDIFQKSNISLYPNPATNQLTIHTSSRHQYKTIRIIIINAIGEIIQNQTLKLSADLNINIKALSRGVYFLQLKTETWSVVKRFVKE